MMKSNKNITVAICIVALVLVFGFVLKAQFLAGTNANAPAVASVPESVSRALSVGTTNATAYTEHVTSETQSASAVKISSTKQAPLANAPVVCIDPGHPSETSDGARANGLSENTLNWQVAQKLGTRLEAMGIRCVLTKDSLNQRVTNRERAEIANRAGAKVLVRLHCDVGGGHGYTWYYPDRSGHKYGVTGPPKSVQLASRRAARVINEAMRPVLNGHLRSNEIKTDASTFVGGKQGGVLTGSIFARVPTALIEMCYINQKKDAQFIASQAGQDLMAEALAKGIYAFVEEK